MKPATIEALIEKELHEFGVQAFIYQYSAKCSCKHPLPGLFNMMEFAECQICDKTISREDLVNRTA